MACSVQVGMAVVAGRAGLQAGQGGAGRVMTYNVNMLILVTTFIFPPVGWDRLAVSQYFVLSEMHALPVRHCRWAVWQT